MDKTLGFQGNVLENIENVFFLYSFQLMYTEYIHYPMEGQWYYSKEVVFEL